MELLQFVVQKSSKLFNFAVVSFARNHAFVSVEFILHSGLKYLGESLEPNFNFPKRALLNILKFVTHSVLFISPSLRNDFFVLCPFPSLKFEDFETNLYVSLFCFLNNFWRTDPIFGVALKTDKQNRVRKMIFCLFLFYQFGASWWGHRKTISNKDLFATRKNVFLPILNFLFLEHSHFFYFWFGRKNTLFSW